jgi:hypothetical protein
LQAAEEISLRFLVPIRPVFALTRAGFSRRHKDCEKIFSSRFGRAYIAL